MRWTVAGAILGSVGTYVFLAESVFYGLALALVGLALITIGARL